MRRIKNGHFESPFFHKMGQRGREYATERHSKDRLIADMDRMYRNLLQ